jgi:hypothetical protein
MKRLCALLSVAVLIAPPVQADAKSVMVGLCGGGNVRVSIPFKAPLPGGDDHGCCKKGCHAANERKKKADGTDDDDCC